MTLTLDPPTLEPPELDEPVDDGTRRELIAAGVALSLGLAACGDAQDRGPESETRRVRDALGVKSVPVDPRRIVTLHEGMLAYLAGLGLGDRVIGSLIGVAGAGSVEEGVADYIADALDRPAAIRPLGVYTGAPVDVEPVARLRPDLIVGYETQAREQGEQLARIAPIVAPAYEGNHDWASAARQLAVMLGDPRSFDAAQRRLDRMASEVRERLGEATRAEVSLVFANSANEFSVIGTDAFEGELLDRVGFRRPANQDKVAGASVLEMGISVERIARWDGDFLLVIAASREQGEAFLAGPTVRRLGSVQAGNVAIVDGRVWRAGNHLAAFAVLERFPEIFAPLLRDAR